MLVVARGAALLMALLQGYARQHGPSLESVSAADSQRVLRRARSAQTEFEAFRRNRLPIGYRSSQPCDIHVGRYCYWRGDEGDESRRRRNNRPFASVGPRFFERSTAHRAVLPGDAWIVGQVVRYLVEVDSTDAALTVAREQLPRHRKLVPCARRLRVAQRWTIRRRRFGVRPLAGRDGARRPVPLAGHSAIS